MNDFYCRQCKKVIKANDEYCGGCGAMQNQKASSISIDSNQPTVQRLPGPTFLPEAVLLPPVKRQSGNRVALACMGILLVLLVVNHLYMKSKVDLMEERVRTMSTSVDHLEKQVHMMSTGVDKLGQDVGKLGNTVDYNAGVSNRNNDAIRRGY